MTTAEIALRHGHVGPTVCQDCGTARNLHYGNWYDPQTQQSGDFLECCNCGIKAGDAIEVHAHCKRDAEPDA